LRGRRREWLQRLAASIEIEGRIVEGEVLEERRLVGPKQFEREAHSR